MKNTHFELTFGTRLPREIQMKRLKRVIREELTDLQRQALVWVYFENRTQAELAQVRGVNKSTISRTLHRAEEKLRRILKY